MESSLPKSCVNCYSWALKEAVTGFCVFPPLNCSILTGDANATECTREELGYNVLYHTTACKSGYYLNTSGLCVMCTNPC